MTGLTGLAVRPRLLSEEIYSTLRTAIIEERLPPGMKIVEERLAGELGVSRIPLREALHKLERDGFVQSLAHRGFRVTSFNAENVRQVYEIRELLEVSAATKARGHIDEAGAAGLLAIVQQMEDEVAAENDVAVVGLHARFHRTIYEAGDNERLTDLLGPYLELGFCYRTVKQAGVESWSKFFEDHRRLVEVVQHGKASEVAKTMTEHLAKGRELSLKVAAQG